MNTRNALPFLVLLAACFALAAGAATYKWVDKDGKVHYSDQPVAGAEKVDLKPISEVPSIEVPQSDSGATNETPAEPQADNGMVYTGLMITSPTQGQEMRGSGLSLTFQAQAVPDLGSGDKIEYLLDGKVVPQHLPYIDRGTHGVIARVVGANGDIKVGSDEVTFTVFQNVATPAPAPKPKPTK